MTPSGSYLLSGWIYRGTGMNLESSAGKVLCTMLRHLEENRSHQEELHSFSQLARALSC